MLSRESLTKEFISVVDTYYPSSGKILKHCYVKILECYIQKLGKRLYYIGIYYPRGMQAELQAQQKKLKEIAENMGLIEVVFIDATRLVRDPLSKLKEENPRLWLELYWVATHPID
ncbi:MAG: hypothetical protein QNJ38_08255 [Prochloraceae cyanobacterium]|nr:hypothetical protein [Prochloraceae cyanobacterium]